jgi:hypothetical protein
MFPNYPAVINIAFNHYALLIVLQLEQPETVEEALILWNDMVNSTNLIRNYTNISIGQFLGKSKDPKVFAPLISALKNSSEYIRSDAVLGLGYLGNQDAIP